MKRHKMRRFVFFYFLSCFSFVFCVHNVDVLYDIAKRIKTQPFLLYNDLFPGFEDAIHLFSVVQIWYYYSKCLLVGDLLKTSTYSKVNIGKIGWECLATCKKSDQCQSFSISFEDDVVICRFYAKAIPMSYTVHESTCYFIRFNCDREMDVLNTQINTGQMMCNSQLCIHTSTLVEYVRGYGSCICPNNLYGSECKSLCSCRKHEICNPVSGACMKVCAIRGYAGPFCLLGNSTNLIKFDCVDCYTCRPGYYAGSHSLLCRDKCKCGPFTTDKICYSHSGRCLCQIGVADAYCSTHKTNYCNVNNNLVEVKCDANGTNFVANNCSCICKDSYRGVLCTIQSTTTTSVSITDVTVEASSAIMQESEVDVQVSSAIMHESELEVDLQVSSAIMHESELEVDLQVSSAIMHESEFDFSGLCKNPS